MQPILDERIAEIIDQLAVEPQVLAVLLIGSYATGRAWPGSDVDLLVIQETEAVRKQIFDYDSLIFDISHSTFHQLEEAMTADGLVCHSGLVTISLAGDIVWKSRIEQMARQIYAQHVPGRDSLDRMCDIVHSAAYSLRVMLGRSDPVAQAMAASSLVWIATTVCLGTAGLGPLPQLSWHEALARLPFDALGPYTAWYTADRLPERVAAAFTLAEHALHGQVERTAAIERTPTCPQFEHRPALEPEAAVDLERMVRPGKIDKAVWLKDAVQEAVAARNILWFAAPACLALCGIAEPEYQWLHAALSQIALPFDATALHAQAWVGESLTTRTAAACELGRRTGQALKTVYANTGFEHKYLRTRRSSAV
jgi:predicted nucleotidyltransferase